MRSARIWQYLAIFCDSKWNISSTLVRVGTMGDGEVCCWPPFKLVLASLRLDCAKVFSLYWGGAMSIIGTWLIFSVSLILETQLLKYISPTLNWNKWLTEKFVFRFDSGSGPAGGCCSMSQVVLCICCRFRRRLVCGLKKATAPVAQLFLATVSYAYHASATDCSHGNRTFLLSHLICLKTYKWEN